jgi:transcriptional regulator with XRE-family HTH domain
MKISSLNIWEKLANLAKSQKKPLKTAAKETGVSEGAISGWKKSFPTVDNLAYIAHYYGVSLDYLVFNENSDNNKLTPGEMELVLNYRNLTEDNRRNVRALINSMLSIPAAGKKEKKAKTGEENDKKRA